MKVKIWTDHDMTTYIYYPQVIIKKNAVSKYCGQSRFELTLE